MFLITFVCAKLFDFGEEIEGCFGLWLSSKWVYSSAPLQLRANSTAI